MKNIIYNNKKKKETKFIKFTLSKLGKKKRLFVLIFYVYMVSKAQVDSVNILWKKEVGQQWNYSVHFYPNPIG